MRALAGRVLAVTRSVRRHGAADVRRKLAFRTRLHDPRQAAVTRMPSERVDVATVAGMLGRAAPIVTLGIDAHLLRDVKTAAADARQQRNRTHRSASRRRRPIGGRAIPRRSRRLSKKGESPSYQAFFQRFEESRRSDSNRRSAVYKTAALPTKLRRPGGGASAAVRTSSLRHSRSKDRFAP